MDFRDRTLVRLEYEALQVLGLRQVEHDGVVKSGAAALEQADAAAGIDGGCGHGALEFGPADVVRARVRVFPNKQNIPGASLTLTWCMLYPTALVTSAITLSLANLAQVAISIDHPS